MYKRGETIGDTRAQRHLARRSIVTTCLLAPLARWVSTSDLESWAAMGRAAARSVSRVIPLVGSICLLHVLVGCARPEALTGRVSALAVPVPVLLGPVRCLGECGAEPAGSHAFKTAPTVEIASERRTTSTSTSSASTVLGTQTTTTTSTAVSRGESSAVLFSGALLGPLLAQPFSRRRVIQLSRLDLGRTVDEVTGTNRNSSDVSLLVSGRGGWHVLPAPRAAAGEPEKETRE